MLLIFKALLLNLDLRIVEERGHLLFMQYPIEWMYQLAWFRNIIWLFGTNPQNTPFLANVTSLLSVHISLGNFKLCTIPAYCTLMFLSKLNYSILLPFFFVREISQL